jgi:hypothetical protein
VASAEELLRRSLTHAARAPYYARAWAGRHLDVRTEADLPLLPVLDKATAIKHQDDLVVGPEPPGFGIASSGTTRTRDLPPLHVRPSPPPDDAEDELDAGAGRVVADAAAAEPAHVDGPPPEWTLVALGAHHGLPRWKARPRELRVLWSYHPNAPAMIEACLARPQPDGCRVTTLLLSAGALKTLTARLLDRGVDPSAWGVRTIRSTGSRLSPAWRAVVEQTWAARAYDDYSLSEIQTPATECEDCGALHFRAPPLLYEVLDLRTGAQKSAGRGRLVVTTLAPWITTMPLVRYDTGDVVEVGGVCASTGSWRLALLGRAARGVVVEDRGEATFVLAPVLVQDVLEASPETERNPHPAQRSGVAASRELGMPRFTTELQARQRGAPAVLLRFEARFDPRIHRARADALRLEVETGLKAGDAVLAGLVEEGRLRLEVVVHPPGTLDPPGDKLE